MPVQRPASQPGSASARRDQGTTRRRVRANFGATSVDLFAPGGAISRRSATGPRRGTGPSAGDDADVDGGADGGRRRGAVLAARRILQLDARLGCATLDRCDRVDPHRRRRSAASVRSRRWRRGATCARAPAQPRGCPDADGDGVRDGVDNCADRRNADQADADGDGSATPATRRRAATTSTATAGRALDDRCPTRARGDRPDGCPIVDRRTPTGHADPDGRRPTPPPAAPRAIVSLAVQGHAEVVRRRRARARRRRR